MSDEAANDSMTAPPIEQRWPNVPACEMEVYGFKDPMWGANMVAMTQRTWEGIHKEHMTMVKRIEQLTHELVQMKTGVHPDGPRIVLPS